jgi:NTP pyrophosphatase (non-canonical NTP hydrolase)
MTGTQQRYQRLKGWSIKCKGPFKTRRLRMKSNEYVNLCKRTEPPELANIKTSIDRIFHGVMGCVTESGELMDAIKKHFTYGEKLDGVNIFEELGDLSWYISIILDEMGATWEEIWEMNINKLKQRFPDKFDSQKALNRDLSAEREGLEMNLIERIRRERIRIGEQACVDDLERMGIKLKKEPKPEYQHPEVMTAIDELGTAILSGKGLPIQLEKLALYDFVVKYFENPKDL